MPWEQSLEVTAGRVRFVPDGTGETFTLSGILECREPFLVWFQVVEHSPPFPVSANRAERGVVGGTVTLRARKPTELRHRSPDYFAHLSSILLAPTERQHDYGYAFSADLEMGAGPPLRCALNDMHHRADDHVQVQFAYLNEPYVLIRDGRCENLITVEWLLPALRQKLHKEHGWPPMTARGG